MGKKLFVENLSFRVTQTGLEGLFARSGTVSVAKIATDRYSGKPRDFAYVEMSSAAEAELCVRELNGSEFEGRQLSVILAKTAAKATRDAFRRSF